MALSIFTVIYTHKSTRLRSTGDSRSKYEKGMGTVISHSWKHTRPRRPLFQNPPHSARARREFRRTAS